jgi:hypothetical protein
MKIKRTRANKVHVCDTCEEDILPGEFYHLFETRLPRIGEFSDDQVGVKFIRIKTCNTCREEELDEQAAYEELCQTEEFLHVEAHWEHRYP